LSLLSNANAVPPLIVDGVTDLLKVTDTWVKGPTLVVPLAGVTETTVNGVVSAVLAVVKLLPKKARLPATSATLFTFTVKRVLPGRLVSGVNVTPVPFTA